MCKITPSDKHAHSIPADFLSCFWAAVLSLCVEQVTDMISVESESCCRSAGLFVPAGREADGNMEKMLRQGFATDPHVTACEA